MLIVAATINMAQSLCTSAFEAGHVNRLHVFVHKLSENILNFSNALRNTFRVVAFY